MPLRPGADTSDVDDTPIAPDGLAAGRAEEAVDVRDSDAEYRMEYPAVCPVCGRTIRTVKVVRLLRSRVNFTSTLPRHGRVVICPACRTILSAALSIA
jgi:hypothetical protein